MATPPETRIERKRLGGGQFVSIVLLYACLVGLSLITWFNARRATETAAQVDHAKTVLGESDASLSSVVRDTAVVGIGLLSALRAIRPLRGIVVSGYGMEAGLRRSRDAGFAAHLVKPFNVARLEEAIDQAMRAHPGAA